MSHDEVQLELRKIQASDKVRGLSLGDAEFLPLKIFMEKQAKAYAEQMLATTYCVFSDSKIIGYVSLVCGRVVELPGDGMLDMIDAAQSLRFSVVKIVRMVPRRELTNIDLIDAGKRFRSVFVDNAAKFAPIRARYLTPSKEF